MCWSHKIEGGEGFRGMGIARANTVKKRTSVHGSWHLQCYQSPGLACVKNGACLAQKENRPYYGPCHGGGREWTGKSCQLDRVSDGEVG